MQIIKKKPWIIALSVLLFTALMSLYGLSADERLDQILSKIKSYSGKLQDLRTKGSFKQLIIKHKSVVESTSSTLTGRFEFKRLCPDYFRLDRTFDKPRENGAIADTLLKSPDGSFWLEYFPNPSDPSGKVGRLKEVENFKRMLSPFIMLTPLDTFSQGFIFKEIEGQSLFKLATPETPGALYRLELSSPSYLGDSGSPYNIRDLTAIEIKGLEPIHISYIGSALVLPSGTKTVINEILLGPLLQISTPVPVAKKVKYIDYHYGLGGKKSGKILRQVELQVDEAQVNSGLGADDFTLPLPEQ